MKQQSDLAGWHPLASPCGQTVQDMALFEPELVFNHKLPIENQLSDLLPGFCEAVPCKKEYQRRYRWGQDPPTGVRFSVQEENCTCSKQGEQDHSELPYGLSFVIGDVLADLVLDQEMVILSQRVINHGLQVFPLR